MVRFPIDYTTSVKLNRSIRALYFRHYRNIDNGLFVEEVMGNISKSMQTFDNTKGGLLPYLRVGIRLGLQGFNAKHIPNIGDRDTNLVSPKEEEEEAIIDLSIYTDKEIDSMYNVIHGTPTSKDKATVFHLFNKEEE